MLYLWIDDIRKKPNDNKVWNVFQTVNDTVKFIRRRYKEGYTDFYLDLDHDAGDYAGRGGDYINILRDIETYHAMGHMRNINLTCHFHSMNPVGIQNMKAVCEKNGWKIV